MGRSDSTVTTLPVDDRRSFDWLGPVIIAVATALAMLILSRPVQEPDVVPRVKIVNPSDARVDVDLSDDGSGWMPLSIVEQRSPVTVRDVIDPGDRWIFRFSVAGEPIGEVRRARDVLARDGWRIELPQSVVDNAHSR
jgi:hypothetical protein